MASTEAREAMTQMRRRYPVGRADVEPRVFLRATDNWVELSARFVVPVRDARRVKDEMTGQVLRRFAEAGLSVASATQEVMLHPLEERVQHCSTTAGRICSASSSWVRALTPR